MPLAATAKSFPARGAVQIGADVFMAARTVSLSLIAVPSLRVSVFHIVEMTAKEEMPEIDAGRVIAAMTDRHPRWDRPAIEFPDNTMHTPHPVCDADLTVSRGDSGSVP